MNHIILRYKNYELLENNSMFELRKDGTIIVEAINDLDNIFNTIELEESKEVKKEMLRNKLENTQKDTLDYLNQNTDLQINNINYEELIDGRQGFTKKGFLVYEGDVKRLFTKEELIDFIINFYENTL